MCAISVVNHLSHFVQKLIIITHAGCIAAGVGRVFSRSCLSVYPRSKRKTS